MLRDTPFISKRYSLPNNLTQLKTASIPIIFTLRRNFKKLCNDLILLIAFLSPEAFNFYSKPSRFTLRSTFTNSPKCRQVRTLRTEFLRGEFPRWRGKRHGVVVSAEHAAFHACVHPSNARHAQLRIRVLRSKDVLEKCKKGSYFWSWGAERLVAQTALSHFVHRLVWRSPRIAKRFS